MSELVFLKFGGSLITDKSVPYTPRFDKLAELAADLSGVLQSYPNLSIVLGHGSGSFGHTAAREYHTRDGLPSPSGKGAALTVRPSLTVSKGDRGERDYWQGFAEVWFQAVALNRFVMDSLHTSEVPSLALAPVSALTTSDGKVSGWDLTPLKAALAARLIPVIYGDVVFDSARGGTILSTEDLFAYLARELRPQRILLAGLEAAVWADFPARKQRVETLTPASFEGIKSGVGASRSPDVTGGMESKVRQMLELTQELPGLTVQIFSGEQPGNIQKALAGENLGTLIRAD